MQSLIIETQQKRQVLDITDIINKHLQEAAIDLGICNLFLLHTTAAITTADLDPGTDLDMLDAFGELIPRLQYRHPHNPLHVKDHINSSLIGASLSLPFENKHLVLGTWQKVVLIEFDGPRSRNLKMHVSS